MVNTFLKFYSAESPRWDNITYLASNVGWSNFVENSASEYLSAQGVSKAYVDEIIESVTRVNYGQVCLFTLLHSPSLTRRSQDADAIHALEGLVSMATSGAAAVVGGNFQIFQKFIDYSNATLHLDTTVSPF